MTAFLLLLMKLQQMHLACDTLYNTGAEDSINNYMQSYETQTTFRPGNGEIFLSSVTLAVLEGACVRSTLLV